MFAVARELCGAQVAEDVTKEVFLHLWNHPERYGTGRSSLRASLLRATRDVAVDTVRFAGRDASGVASTGARRGAAGVREVMVLVSSGGCTYREAASALGLDDGTVKRRIRDGLRNGRRVTADPAPAPRAVERVVDLRGAPDADHGLAEALDSRDVVAQAQGIIMEREGTTAGAAYRRLLDLSGRRRMTLPACANAVVGFAAQSQGAQAARD